MKRTTITVLGLLLTFILGFSADSLSLAPAYSQGIVGLADTPWAMYQHDERHTGRSPFQGPQQSPEVLFTTQLPEICSINGGGMVIAPDGTLIISAGNCLFRFDMLNQKLLWLLGSSGTESTPLMADNGQFYWGASLLFGSYSLQGRLLWQALLNDNYVFNSSPVLGADGNLYFVHDAVWSFTPQGDFRWLYPNANIASHTAPAIGKNGEIYAGEDFTDLCSYSTQGEQDWCLDTVIYAQHNNPSVAANGNIYLPGHGGMVAVQPNHEVAWNFIPSSVSQGAEVIGKDIAIAGDESLRVYMNSSTLGVQSALYAIESNGSERWHTAFPANSLTGGSADILHPLLVDRDGSAYLCLANSSCYAVSAAGSVLWEYDHVLLDSIIATARLQPLLIDDGLMVEFDNLGRLVLRGDPALWSSLSSPATRVELSAEPGSPPVTYTIPVSSTLDSIVYTATLEGNDLENWVNFEAQSGSTPGEILLQLDPSALLPGIYTATLTIRPQEIPGRWIHLPVKFNVGMSQVFLPVVANDANHPYRLVYRSDWFTQHQLASIDQNGETRTALRVDYPTQTDQAVLSPDRSKLAVTVTYSKQNTPGVFIDLQIIDAHSGERLATIQAEQANAYPSWSPDSQQLIFIGISESSPERHIFRVNADGSGLQQITSGFAQYDNPLWSPAAGAIAASTSFRTYLMDENGQNVQDLFPNLPYLNQAVGWSPDGRYLMTISQPDGAGLPYELWILDFVTGEYGWLADDVVHENPAVWSPDRKWIAYLAYQDAEQDLYLVRPDGSGRRKLSQSGSEEGWINWSHDSRWLAFTSRSSAIYQDPNWDIFVVQPDGSDLHQVTKNIQADTQPFWLLPDWVSRQ